VREQCRARAAEQQLRDRARLAEEGQHVIISSHILHEVDAISDQVILLSSGYVVAEGQIHGVRTEVEDHPMQILIRCSNPTELAAQVFQKDCAAVEARIHNDGMGVLVKTGGLAETIPPPLPPQAIRARDENTTAVRDDQRRAADIGSLRQKGRAQGEKDYSLNLKSVSSGRVGCGTFPESCRAALEQTLLPLGTWRVGHNDSRRQTGNTKSPHENAEPSNCIRGPS
jgi:ABC-type glutathione transport system ATPase component